MRYIVVAFWDGIGHTLQGENTLLWYFKYDAKCYTKLACAIKKAKRIKAKFSATIEKVVVYRIDATERFSCSDFSRWDKEDGRIKFEISNVKIPISLA
jgi:hypothetical protein